MSDLLPYRLYYHCVLCDQEFQPDDTVTGCPQSATGAHTILEVRRALATPVPPRSQDVPATDGTSLNKKENV